MHQTGHTHLPIAMKKLLLLSSVLLTLSASAQNLTYAKQIVNELSSPKYYGRGYINKGDSIAANFLVAEMKKIKIKPLMPGYLQPYTLPINTIEGVPSVAINGKSLEVASEFFINPASPSIEGTYDIVRVNKKVATQNKHIKELFSTDFSNKFLLVDTLGMNNKELSNFLFEMGSSNFPKAKGVIVVNAKLKNTARTFTSPYPIVHIRQSALDSVASTISLNVKSSLNPGYKTQNIVGFIEGEVDTFMVFSAHYDHLGMQGGKIYPGANDNASGVARVLDLAKHFKHDKKPHYSIAFLLFSAEEAGLKGSEFFVENSPIPLSKIKLVMNFDMVATGSTGVYLFNGKEYPDVLEDIIDINSDNKYIANLTPTPAVPSSDHASFHNKGVKALFFFTDGGNNDYHEVTDTPEKHGYQQYEGIFSLVRDIVEQE